MQQMYASGRRKQRCFELSPKGTQDATLKLHGSICVLTTDVNAECSRDALACQQMTVTPRVIGFDHQASM